MSAEPVHFVTVEHTYTEDDGVPEVDITSTRFECRAATTAPCRNYPDCDCEGWGAHHEHPSVPQGECWMQGWFDAGYEGALYIDPTSGDVIDYEHDIPAGSGPIEVEFDEGITWSWLPEPVAMTFEEAGL